VPQMQLQGPWVAGLPKALDGVRVAQEVGVNLLETSAKQESIND